MIFYSPWPTRHRKDTRFWLAENKLSDLKSRLKQKKSLLRFGHFFISKSKILQKSAANVVCHTIPPISWQHSQLDAHVPLAAMCRTQPGFQNGDCVLTMSSWGIRVMELKYLILRRPLMFQLSVILTRTCYLLNVRKLGNWHNATME